jgi:allantoinase
VIYDTVICNGDVVTETGIHPFDIGILDGRIAALLIRGAAVEAQERIDATGRLVLPGAIDIHWHCRAPAYPERGDFATETRAAAAGGVTTVFEMPISKPCCATGDIFRSRKALADANVYVNYGLYAAPGLLKRDEIEDMVAEGAIGFKVFMTSAPAARFDEFEGLCLPEVPELRQALTLIAQSGLVCSVHAENEQLIQWHTQQLTAALRNDASAHNESRPPHVEAVGIATLLALNEDIGAYLHIAHVSCRTALDMVRRFRRSDMSITAETCPHYLFFTEADLERVGPAKVNPPLRKVADQIALWEGVTEGTLIAVTTDHSPFTVEEKERARTDIWRTPPGAPGVEELVPGMMDMALGGRISVEHAVRLISTNGAKRFGIYPQKGVIAVGSDADLIIYDPHTTTTIRPEMLFTKAKDCDRLYLNRTFQGRVERTIVNGKTVFHNGQIIGERGWGKFVRPDPARIHREL